MFNLGPILEFLRIALGLLNSSDHIPSVDSKSEHVHAAKTDISTVGVKHDVNWPANFF